MLYTFKNKNFKHHIHPSLTRRIRIFMVIGAIMLGIMVADIVRGALSSELALMSVVLGGIVGFFTSRIFHLSWSEDGNRVVGRIDTLGWVVLVLYIAFEIARSYFFQELVPASATAVTFAFVASALITRVLGLRGRIIEVLKRERVI